MSITPEDFFNNLLEIKSLYIDVKEVIILAENLDKNYEIYLAPLNELRNAFDHLMRSLLENEDPEKEFNEAKEHLYRAGYDAYELLNINLGQAIVQCVEEYDASIISTVFPRYYQEIKPSLTQIQIELADTRAHKRTDPSLGIKSFKPYKEKIILLTNHLKFCQQHIPNLAKEKIRKKRKNFSNAIIGILIGILTIVAGSYIYDKYVKDNPTQIKTMIHNKSLDTKTIAK